MRGAAKGEECGRRGGLSIGFGACLEAPRTKEDAVGQRANERRTLRERAREGANAIRISQRAHSVMD